MATGSSIKTAIELVGGDAVVQESKRIGAALEQTAAKINDIGKTATPSGGLQQFFVSMKSGTQSVNEHARAVGGLSDAYHVLHPILGVAGLRIAEFRAFAVAANLGILGLAAAVGGSVLVALGRLAEAAAEVRQRLIDMAGPDLGEKLSAQFKQAEVATNSASGAMAGAAEAILRAVKASKGATEQWQASGAAIKDLSVVTRTWSEAIQLGKVNADDAAKSVNTIAQAIFKLQSETRPGEKQTIIDFSSGVAEFKQVETEAQKVTTAVGLTFETFTQLETLSPILGRKISEAFGFKDIDQFRASLSQAPKSIEELISATAKMAPEIDKLFQNIDAKSRGIGESATIIKNAVGSVGTDSAEKIGLFTNVISAIADVFSRAAQEDKNLEQNVQTFNARWAETMRALNTQPPANWGEAFAERLRDLKRLADELRMSLGSVGDLSGGSVTGTLGIGGGATGGLFRGKPGRDTNLFWLTDYEYIMNPSAVKKYGIDFMHMINSLQWPVKGFASGGLVDRRPAMATSGRLPSNNQRPFVLNIPGAGSFRGSIAAPEHVMEQLSRASTFEQMTQGGRSPGWRR